MTSHSDPPDGWLAAALLPWFDLHGRKDLPWQQDINPYRVWVSEIMLQQTQVTTVIGYYQRFIARFPTVAALAAAPLDDVLHHWTGLGYYARGRNLHKAAGQIMAEHGGALPVGVAALSDLPGIGRSTAGAIAAISQGQWAAILDGNVKRVLTRVHALPGYPGERAVAQILWQRAEQHTPPQRTAAYTQAIMDLGATLCTRSTANCAACPLRTHCKAHSLGRVADFPARKPKKDKPVRTARLWLLEDSEGRLLLEQRPPAGIWGGLWTPPEREPAMDRQQLLAELGIAEHSIQAQQSLQGFRHSFTHYHLDLLLERLSLRARQPELLVAEVDRFCWYDRRNPATIGLSAPTVKVLEQLAQPQPFTTT